MGSCLWLQHAPHRNGCSSVVHIGKVKTSLLNAPRRASMCKLSQAYPSFLSLLVVGVWPCSSQGIPIDSWTNSRTNSAQGPGHIFKLLSLSEACKQKRTPCCLKLVLLFSVFKAEFLSVMSVSECAAKCTLSDIARVPWPISHGFL